jgi:hypothetical protein
MPESTAGRNRQPRDQEAPTGLGQDVRTDPRATEEDALRLEDLPDTTVRNLAVRAGRRLAGWVIAGFAAFSLPELSTALAIMRQGALLVAVIGMLTTIWQINGLLRRLGWWPSEEEAPDNNTKSNSQV